MIVQLKVDRKVPLIGCWFCSESFVLITYKVPAPIAGAGPTIISRGEACFCPFCGRNQQWREDEKEEEE